MRWILLLPFLALAPSVYGQTFSAAAIAGFNAAQIDGDQLAGFDKVGLVAGLRGSAILSERVDLHVEFLYSQRGSRPDIFNATIDPDIEVNLQYLDLPVYISYGDWLHEEHKYYRVSACGGFSYGRLIRATTFDHYNSGEEDLDNLVDEFNKNDISFLVGFTYRASPHFLFSFRYTRSITLLLNAQKKGLSIPSLRPYFLSFRTEYIF